MSHNYSIGTASNISDNSNFNMIIGGQSHIGANCNDCFIIGSEVNIPDNSKSLTIIGNKISFEQDILDPTKTVLPSDCPRENAIYISGKNVFIEHKGKFISFSDLLDKLLV